MSSLVKIESEEKKRFVKRVLKLCRKSGVTLTTDTSLLAVIRRNAIKSKRFCTAVDGGYYLVELFQLENGQAIMLTDENERRRCAIMRIRVGIDRLLIFTLVYDPYISAQCRKLYG